MSVVQRDNLVAVHAEMTSEEMEACWLHREIARVRWLRLNWRMKEAIEVAFELLIPQAAASPQEDVRLACATELGQIIRSLVAENHRYDRTGPHGAYSIYVGREDEPPSNVSMHEFYKAIRSRKKKKVT